MSSNNIYICSICNKHFSSQSSLFGHQWIHSNSYRTTQQNLKKLTYDNNPKLCLQCKTTIPYEKHMNIFCSSSCAATYNNKKKDATTINKQKETLKQTLIKKHKLQYPEYSKLYYCKFCGKIHQSIENRTNCNCGFSCIHNLLLNSLQKYFNLNLSKLGTKEMIPEMELCKKFITSLYKDNSLLSMAKLIGHPRPGNLAKILIAIGISLNNLSTSQRKSILQNRKNLPITKKYKNGWYTTKDGKNYYYRSSYELQFIKLLENNNISFDMETPFEYYDSQKNQNRIALPDFIIKNKIVEIKSNYTFDEINMIDKFVSYKNYGYNPILQLDFKYYELVNNCFHEIENFNIKNL